MGAEVAYMYVVFVMYPVAEQQYTMHGVQKWRKKNVHKFHMIKK